MQGFYIKPVLHTDQSEPRYELILGLLSQLIVASNHAYAIFILEAAIDQLEALLRSHIPALIGRCGVKALYINPNKIIKNLQEKIPFLNTTQTYSSVDLI